VAVDQNGYAYSTSDAETGWSAGQSISSNSVTGVSCPSASAGFCIAVNSAGYYDITQNSGTNWFLLELSHGADLTAVSCVSSSFCVAVDNAGNAYAYNGSFPWVQTDADGDVALTSVSCVTDSFCVAGDSAGNVVIDDSSWGSPVNLSSSAINSVSCASTTLCVAVDNAGNAYVYNGTAWSSAETVDTSPLISVSCGASTFCAAIDDGSDWSQGTPAPALVTSSLPDATNGEAYSEPVSASGGGTPYTWSATGLPNGLSIDPAAGTISGTPDDTAGPFTVEVTVTGSDGVTVTTPLDLTVDPAVTPTTSTTSTTVAPAPAPVQIVSTTTTTTTLPPSPPPLPAKLLASAKALPYRAAMLDPGTRLLGRLPVRVSCMQANCLGTVRLTVARRDGPGWRHLLLAQGSVDLTVGTTKILHLQPTGLGQQMLGVLVPPWVKRFGRFRMTLSVRLTAEASKSSPVFLTK
jgi:hypothetical protein